MVKNVKSHNLSRGTKFNCLQIGILVLIFCICQISSKHSYKVLPDVLNAMPDGCQYFCLGCDADLTAQLKNKPIMTFDAIEGKAAGVISFKFLKRNTFCATIISTNDKAAFRNVTLLESTLFRAEMPLVILMVEGGSRRVAIMKSLPTVIIRALETGYSVSVSYKNQINKVNFWSLTNGFALDGIGDQLQLPITRARLSMRGQHFTVAAIGYEPFIHYGEDIGGVDIRILDVVAEAYNFTYQLKMEKTWMVVNKKTGEISGAIGSVYNGVAQIGIGDIAVMYERIQLIDYTTMLYSLANVLITRKPRLLPPFENILKPFSVTLWCLICTGLILFTGILALTNRVRNHNIHPWHIAIKAYEVLVGQNHEDKSFKGATLIALYASWLIGNTFLHMAYTSNLRAYLMSATYEKQLDSAQDILDLNKMFYVASGTSTESTFATSNRPDFQQIYSAYIKKHGNITLINGWVPECVERKMVDNGDVFIGTQFIKQTQYSKLIERYGYDPFRESKFEIMSFHRAFAVIKPTPWKLEMDKTLGRLRDMGFVQKFIADQMVFKANIDEETASRDQQKEPQVSKFTMAHVAAIHFVMLVGLLMAGLMFLCELGLNFYIKKSMFSTNGKKCSIPLYQFTK